MVRIIAWSFAESAAFMLCAVCCWYLFSHCFERLPWDGLPLIIGLYPLPIAVAAVRKHKAILDIIWTNLWFGWTVIGWFLIMIWACKSDVEALSA
jgi:T4 superinfection immunity protein